METTGKVNIGGALHAISTDHIVAYTGDLYDAAIGKFLSEINQLISTGGGSSDPVSLTVDNVLLKEESLISLSDILGIDDSSTVTTNEVAPNVLLYDPISNTYKNTSSISVEYGTLIYSVGSVAKFKFNAGSSGGISTSPIYIRITDGSEELKLATETSGIYTAQAFSSAHSTTSTSNVIVQITDSDKNTNISTSKGDKTVTKTTSMNVVANKILDASHKPIVILGPSVTTEEIDYDSKTIGCTITYTPFKYMYMHRTSTKPTTSTYSGSIGKTGYLLRRTEGKGSWVNSSTTNTSYYYVLLVPNDISVSSMYTTFLGSDSSVLFELIGTTTMNGATSACSATYKIYSSKNPFPMGGGTMTVTFT